MYYFCSLDGTTVQISIKTPWDHLFCWNVSLSAFLLCCFCFFICSFLLFVICKILPQFCSLTSTSIHVRCPSQVMFSVCPAVQQLEVLSWQPSTICWPAAALPWLSAASSLTRHSSGPCTLYQSSAARLYWAPLPLAEYSSILSLVLPCPLGVLHRKQSQYDQKTGMVPPCADAFRCLPNRQLSIYLLFFPLPPSAFLSCHSSFCLHFMQDVSHFSLYKARGTCIKNPYTI